MTDQPVMRLFRCRPEQVAFDAILRDVLIPDLRLMPGMTTVHVGRQGPGEDGERLIASIWSSLESMLAAMGPDIESSTFHPEHLSATIDRSLQVLPLSVARRFPGETRAGVIRLAKGAIGSGDLAAYIDDVDRGAAADRARGVGPLALYVAAEAAGRFTTLSTWLDWAAIEAATGADVRRPVATQRGDRLLEFEATHFEVVPDIVAG